MVFSLGASNKVGQLGRGGEPSVLALVPSLRSVRAVAAGLATATAAACVCRIAVAVVMV